MYFFMLHNLAKFLEFGLLFSLNFSLCIIQRVKFPLLEILQENFFCCVENGFDDVFFHIF